MAYARGASRHLLTLALALATFVALVLEMSRLRYPAVEHRVEQLLGSVLRDRERRHVTGATWLLIAFVGLVGFAPRLIAIAGTWAVAVGDSLAALVGRAVGRGRNGGKTTVGSVTCAVATLVGALWLAHLSAAESVVAAASAALAERPMLKVDDNMRIAVAVWAGIFLWRMVFS